MVMALRAAVGAFFLCWVFFPAESRVYDRCELAREFRDIYQFPEDELGTWLCVAYYESLFNTSALNPGSGDHGLFQISEQFWCSPADSPHTKLPCAQPCSVFQDDNIEDDVACARMVYQHHKKVSGDGFTGWVVYNSHCKNPVRVAAFLDGCFGNAPSTTPSSAPPSPAPSSFSTAFRFPKLLSGKTVSYRSTTPTAFVSAQPTSPKPPIKAFKYKPLRPQPVSSPAPLKPQFKLKYKPFTKVPPVSSLSNDISTAFKSEGHRFSSFRTTLRPFSSVASTSAPVNSYTFGGRSGFSTTLKPRGFSGGGGFGTSAKPNKYSDRALGVLNHENAYAIVNNEGHSFAIGPSGFRIVWTGQY